MAAVPRVPGGRTPALINPARRTHSGTGRPVDPRGSQGRGEQIARGDAARDVGSTYTMSHIHCVCSPKVVQLVIHATQVDGMDLRITLGARDMQPSANGRSNIG